MFDACFFYFYFFTWFCLSLLMFCIQVWFSPRKKEKNGLIDTNSSFQILPFLDFYS